MTHYGQKYSLSFHAFTCALKIELFLQENDKRIFVKIRSKFDEGLDFRDLVFKKSFKQITHFYFFSNTKTQARQATENIPPEQTLKKSILPLLFPLFNFFFFSPQLSQIEILTGEIQRYQ